MALLTARVSQYVGCLADAVGSLASGVASIIIDFADMRYNPAPNMLQDAVTAALEIGAFGLDAKVFDWPEV